MLPAPKAHLTAFRILVRRSFDSLCSLRMTTLFFVLLRQTTLPHPQQKSRISYEIRDFSIHSYFS